LFYPHRNFVLTIGVSLKLKIVITITSKMVRSRGAGKRKGQRTPQKVELVEGGAIGDKISRIIGTTISSESQVRVICTQIDNPGSTGALSSYDADALFGTDAFVSMKGQFNEFRLTAIHASFTPINSAVTTFSQGAIVGSTHWNVATGVAPAFTAANVVDLPDSQIVTPGADAIIINWLAKGTFERQFQDTTVIGSLTRKTGAVLLFNATAGATISYLTVVIKYIVDFRGRR